MASIGLAVCGSLSSDNSNNKKIKVVTTIFPEYARVKEIAGNGNDNIELTMLLDNGGDLHSYRTTA